MFWSKKEAAVAAPAQEAPTAGTLPKIFSFELKVKALSLAAEARIIRSIELRLKRRKTASGKPLPGLRDAKNLDAFMKLRGHRHWEVRNEARATHLARTFLAGKPYSAAERKCLYSDPPLSRAGELATKYSGADKRIVAQKFTEWRDAAIAHCKAQA